MTDALTSLDMSTGLRKVADRAKREPAARFHSLAHLIDEELLAGAFARLRGNASVGVDGITNALREVLEAIYEQSFLDCSFGFRPKRSAHDAVRALTRAVDEGEANWILEFDVVSFFDSVRRSQLLEMLQVRVADGSLLRLIGKCLHVGVLDGEVFTEPSEGTVQGSTLSPMLGNVYLHTVLDRWFAEEVRPRLRGKATFIRFADDGVFGFERQDDAERVQAVLSKRMERFGLTLHPEKTRLLDFRRPSRSRGEGRSPTTFDFLGFCWYWRRTRAGSWAVTCKTRRARLARAIQRVYAWCRENRHLPVQQQHAKLVRRVQGHINYFGVNGNIASLRRFVHQARRSWYKWLNRRSQRARLNWERFEDLLESLPLPKARIVVSIWR